MKKTIIILTLITLLSGAVNAIKLPEDYSASQLLATIAINKEVQIQEEGDNLLLAGSALGLAALIESSDSDKAIYGYSSAVFLLSAAIIKLNLYEEPVTQEYKSYKNYLKKTVSEKDSIQQNIVAKKHIEKIIEQEIKEEQGNGWFGILFGGYMSLMGEESIGISTAAISAIKLYFPQSYTKNFIDQLNEQVSSQLSVGYDNKQVKVANRIVF